MANRHANARPARSNRSRAAEPIIDLNDPLSTAKGFCKTRDNRLIRYRGAFYTWAATHYRQLEDEALRKEVYDFLAAGCSPDDRRVSKVIDAIKAHAFVSSDMQAPGWLPHAGMEQYQPADLLAHANRSAG